MRDKKIIKFFEINMYISKYSSEYFFYLNGSGSQNKDNVKASQNVHHFFIKSKLIHYTIYQSEN